MAVLPNSFLDTEIAVQNDKCLLHPEIGIKYSGKLDKPQFIQFWKFLKKMLP